MEIPLQNPLNAARLVTCKLLSWYWSTVGRCQCSSPVKGLCHRKLIGIWLGVEWRVLALWTWEPGGPLALIHVWNNRKRLVLHTRYMYIIGCTVELQRTCSHSNNECIIISEWFCKEQKQLVYKTAPSSTNNWRNECMHTPRLMWKMFLRNILNMKTSDFCVTHSHVL